MLRRIALAIILVASSSAVLAQYDHPQKKRSTSGSRDGRWETSVILAFQTGNDKSFENGSALEIESATGWGISVGWNWTDQFNLAYKFVSTSPRYTALVIPEDPLVPQLIEYKMSKTSHQFNMTYNFSRKAFTPFVIGGVGWTKLDSNVPTGPPDLSCWWDPWWGYICFEDWDTYSASKFTYNLGVGLRWDINNAVFTKASYSREFLKLDNGSLDFDMALFEFGLMF